jgi:macrolide transport system ATP-binding/permease protein
MFLTIRNLTKMYGPALILDDVSLIVNAGERVGLVGANGVGKSTLLNIILGDAEADAGTVVFAPRIEHGYLAQQPATLPGQTIEAVLWDSQRQLRHIQARLDALAAMMSSAQDERLAAILAEYGALAERFEHRGGYAIDHTIDYVLAGLGLSHLPRDRSVEQISGGEKTRLGLAALLISAPDLLLLDEPTNHLDFAAVAWLETFLRERRGAVLTISHDRQFLNRIATTIVEIDEHTHKARTYAGNYDAFLAQKQLERRRWEEEYQRQQAEIGELQQRMKAQNQWVGHNRPASDGDKLAYKAAGERVASTISRNLRAAELALQRILADPIPEPPQPLVFKPAFQPVKSASARALIVEQVSHWYGERQVLDQISFEVYPNSRILLLGPNGTGKTTLLNLLAGLIQPQRGSVQTGAGVAIGYLRQESQRDHAQRTIFEAYREGMIGFPSAIMNDLLAWGLFSYDETTRRLADVSMGQYHKLQIARLMAAKANLLLLDEPTNHVSFEVLEQFEAALHHFPGPVIAVSHDRWFIRHFRGAIWLLDRGRLIIDREQVLARLPALDLGEQSF